MLICSIDRRVVLSHKIAYSGAPLAKEIYPSQKIWLSRDRTPNERPSVRTTGIPMFTVTLSS